MSSVTLVLRELQQMGCWLVIGHFLCGQCTRPIYVLACGVSGWSCFWPLIRWILSGDALWDSLFASGSVLQLLGLLLAADQVIFQGNSATALSFSTGNFLSLFNSFVFLLCLRALCKPLSHLVSGIWSKWELVLRDLFYFCFLCFEAVDLY